MANKPIWYTDKHTLSGWDLLLINSLILKLTTGVRGVGYQDFLAILKNDNYVVVVAREPQRGRVVGIGTIIHNTALSSNNAVIEDMIVSPGFEGRGIGSEILRRLLEQGTQWGVSRIHLTSSFKKARARKMYQKYGFVVDGTSMVLKSK